jgi:hypothetical protein
MSLNSGITPAIYQNRWLICNRRPACILGRVGWWGSNMLTVVMLGFLVFQGLAILLLLSSCAIAATADHRAVRPYIPLAYEPVPSGVSPVTSTPRPAS